MNIKTYTCNYKTTATLIHHISIYDPTFFKAGLMCADIPDCLPIFTILNN